MTEIEKPNSPWAYAWDRFFDTVDVIVAKVTSGRFISTMLLVWTYCSCVQTANILVKEKILDVTTYLVLMGGVGALVTMIVKDYFAKNAEGDK
jgi:Fe2+ transport system protein B